jgi:OPT oligopeptide transporter protein
MQQEKRRKKRNHQTQDDQIELMEADFSKQIHTDEIEKTSADIESEPVDSIEFRRLQPWSKQITVRGIVASLFIGVMYSVIVMKLNLTTGLVPTMNVSAALLAFIFLRAWTKLLNKFGFVTTPFTRQENTVVQTCAVACYSIAVGGW